MLEANIATGQYWDLIVSFATWGIAAHHQQTAPPAFFANNIGIASMATSPAASRTESPV
jgi:hypothetical protein